MKVLALCFALSAMFGQTPATEKDESPHTEHFVQANGVRLHYLDWGGQGEPLVLLTGYGATAHVFDRLATRFTKTFRVIAFTRRGREPSERSSSGYDLRTLTSDLRALLDALKFRRVHLVGHSLAGAEMTEFATLDPERVISLVYLDAALDAAIAEALMKESPVAPSQPPPGSPFAQVRVWWTLYSPDFSKLKAPALALYGVQDRNPFRPPNATDDLLQRLDEFWRTNWTPMIRRTAEKFQRETPNGRVIVLENAGHYFFRDREDEVVRHMHSFYARVINSN